MTWLNFHQYLLTLWSYLSCRLSTITLCFAAGVLGKVPSCPRHLQTKCFHAYMRDAIGQRQSPAVLRGSTPPDKFRRPERRPQESSNQVSLFANRRRAPQRLIGELWQKTIGLVIRRIGSNKATVQKMNRHEACCNNVAWRVWADVEILTTQGASHSLKKGHSFYCLSWTLVRIQSRFHGQTHTSLTKPWVKW